MLWFLNLYGFHKSAAPDFFPKLSHPKAQKAKRDSLLPAVVKRGGNPTATLNSSKRNGLILATTANICHPAPTPRSRPAGPPVPRASRSGGAPVAQPSRVTQCQGRGSAPLPLPPPPPAHRQSPKTTLSVTQVPIQWNVTAPNSPGPSSPPRASPGSP